ncbi:hypothetical protein ACFQXB_16740 [Plastorhodobacter daqingensis]|uniref:DUF2497 domain-containing protein n=1 Tax=Plastorhodobacter daqingensis TaxID=1387281 RepID=A0ABW2UNY9_9RHOB
MSDAHREKDTNPAASLRDDGPLGPLVLTPDLRIVPDAGPQPVPAAPVLSLADTIAELEAALSGGDWEPDTPPAFEPPPPLGRAPSPEPAAIPVADLRPLVAELLREELRGPLGERITHTVRKLVHAEVARTLAARGLQ